jgi:hypothetical protein
MQNSNQNQGSQTQGSQGGQTQGSQGGYSQGSQGGRTQGNGSTGAEDLEYNIIAVMHKLLEGNEALQKYSQDARQAGENDAERIFQQIHEQNRQNVSSLRQLLAKCVAKPEQQGRTQGS